MVLSVCFWSLWRFCLLSMVIFTNCILYFLRDESAMAFTTATLIDPYNTEREHLPYIAPISHISMRISQTLLCLSRTQLWVTE